MWESQACYREKKTQHEQLSQVGEIHFKNTDYIKKSSSWRSKSVLFIKFIDFMKKKG